MAAVLGDDKHAYHGGKHTGEGPEDGSGLHIHEEKNWFSDQPSQIQNGTGMGKEKQARPIHVWS